nr:hypothetical protein [Tanacetum cinerariifolium]
MRGKVYNWKTATYGKIWYDEDVHDLRSVETEFPAIVFNDKLTSEVALSCEPTVSPLNDNQIDFRVSSDESDDEDYTVFYDKKIFSYRRISVYDLKTDSENDNDKVNMPSFPSSEPTVSYFDDFDYFKNFEKEFPAIAYNDALTSKLVFSHEPTVSPQHIDECDETSFSRCDDEVGESDGGGGEFGGGGGSESMCSIGEGTLGGGEIGEFNKPLVDGDVEEVGDFSLEEEAFVDDMEVMVVDDKVEDDELVVKNGKEFI